MHHQKTITIIINIRRSVICATIINFSRHGCSRRRGVFEKGNVVVAAKNEMDVASPRRDKYIKARKAS